MKTHLTKVSLALLAAAFLLGCQERGSEPVGPEGVGPQFAEGGGQLFARKLCDDGNPPPCPKDGGAAEGVPVSVTALEGITSVASWPSQLRTSKNKLNAFATCDQPCFGNVFLPPASKNDTMPILDGGNCQTPDGTLASEGLGTYLTQGFIPPPGNPEGRSVSFLWHVDTRKGTGGLSIGWVQPEGAIDPGENIEIKIGSSKDFGSLTVTKTEPLDDDQTIFTFSASSGGEVRIVRSTNIGQRERLICPYTGPDIVILLDRSPT